MQSIYQIIVLSILLSGMVSGFITFRMSGMKLAPHFIFIILAFLVTIAGLITLNSYVVYGAVVLQLLAVITAYTQTWAVLKYNFQTSPAYAPHLALITLIPVLSIVSVLA
jgi:hypothetical protein